MQELQVQELIKTTEKSLEFYKYLGKVIQKRYGLNLYKMILSKGSTGHVYFLRDNTNGNIKIGTTKNLERRKKQISNNNDDLEFVKVLVTPLDYSINLSVEKFIHGRYKEYRKRGEWFSECVLELFEKEFNEKEYNKLVEDLCIEKVLKILKKQQTLSLLKELMNFIKKELESENCFLDEFEKIDLEGDELFYKMHEVMNLIDIKEINKNFLELSNLFYKVTKDNKYHVLFNGKYHV